MKKFTSKKGSALVMSLFFMAILVTLSFAVNYMLLNEVRSERNFLEGVKAYYSAEAGVEDALFQVSVNNAGDAIESKDDVVFIEEAFELSGGEGAPGSKYSYDVMSRGGANPCILFEDNTEGFAKLDAGESVVIPLNGTEFFNVEYYIVNTSYPFDTPNNNDPTFVMLNDVLRWKILGNRADGINADKLEAISDYFPINGVNFNANNSPSRFGTGGDAPESMPLPEFQNGKYYDIVDGAVGPDSIYMDIDNFADNFAGGAFQYIFHANYPIQSFIGEHENNRLILTNYLNVVPPTEPNYPLNYNAEDYDLYYKVVPLERNDVACGAVQIVSDGFSASEDFKQSIEVVRPLDQATPFTDFVWYQN